jgi:Tfp pilus assembly protein PilO
MIITNPRLSKGLAITLLVISLMLFFELTLHPAYRILEQQWKANSQLEDAVNRYSNIIASEALYKKTIEDIEAQPLPNILYSAASATSLSALLQNDVRELIIQSGGIIDSLQSIPVAQENGLYKMGVKLSMRTDMEILSTLLQRISSTEKLLNTDNVIIRSAENQSTTAVPIITIRWDIYGYGTIHPAN